MKCGRMQYAPTGDAPACDVKRCIVDEQFSKSDMSAGQLKYNLIRVDSMPVHETSSKLSKGFYSNQQGRKAVKYTMAFDGVLPCLSEMFTAPACSSEDIALPQVILLFL
jgi:hypothetical protein